MKLEIRNILGMFIMFICALVGFASFISIGLLFAALFEKI